MTLGKTVLCQKDPSKRNSVDNYRPISYLREMWKLMTGIIAGSIYNFLDVNIKLPVKQKDRGTKDQLIDQTILRTVGRDMQIWEWHVHHSWLLQSLELVQASDSILEFVKRSMANWQIELTSPGESLVKVNIRRWVFQGDSLSPLLFVIWMLPLTHVLR